MPAAPDRARRLDDAGLRWRLGHQPAFARTLDDATWFAVGWGFIAVASGICTTVEFLLQTAGAREIWTWPPVAAGGQFLVALVSGAVAARAPLVGCLRATDPSAARRHRIRRRHQHQPRWPGPTGQRDPREEAGLP
jgi:hypothetical protein